MMLWPPNNSLLALAIGACFANSVWAQITIESKTQHQEILEDCLHHAIQIQKAKIDWISTRTLGDLEQCAFAMALTLRNTEALKEWLQENGFDVTPPRIVPKSVMKLHDVSGQGTRLNGGVLRNGIRLRLGLIDGFVIHSLSIGILFDADDNPVRVQATFTRE